MTTCTKICSITLGIAFTFLATGNARSQSTQSRPAISPWLSMFNENSNGVLSNYHEYVRPRLELYQAYENQQRQIQQQAVQQRVMEQQIQSGVQATLNDGSAPRILAAPNRVKSIGGMQGAGYRQYLHYYPRGLPQGGVPNFATGRRY